MRNILLLRKKGKLTTTYHQKVTPFQRELLIEYNTNNRILKVGTHENLLSGNIEDNERTLERISAGSNELLIIFEEVQEVDAILMQFFEFENVAVSSKVPDVNLWVISLLSRSCKSLIFGYFYN